MWAVQTQAADTQEHAATHAYDVALGVGCEHCRRLDGRTKRAHQTVALMSTIFDLIPTYFDSAVRAPRTQCYMCHQGHLRVERSMPDHP